MTTETIKAAAKAAAATYASEFPGQALDAQSDWDSAAWGLARDNNPGLPAGGWDEFREALRVEVARLVDACDLCGCSSTVHDYDDNGNVLPCNVAPDGSTYSREQLEAEARVAPTHPLPQTKE